MGWEGTRHVSFAMFINVHDLCETLILTYGNSLLKKG